MSISARIHDTIEDWVVEWRDRLRGWMASWVMRGIEQVMDFLEPDLRAEVKTSMDRLKAIPGLPADLKAILDKATEEPKAVQLAAILPYLVGIMIGLGMGAAAPMARIGSYQVDGFIRSARLDPLTAIRAYWRGFITEARLNDALKDQGWSDDDITALQEVTKFIPTADEQTLWLAREVFEPEMIAKYGLDSELPVYEETDFAKIGVTRDQMINKWRAHWEHASWIQVVEMLHRGLLTEPEVWDWFRLVEIPPFWRQLLIDTAYTWPTRVDVRRWWDMRTIDETELRRLYSGMGYRGVNLDNYVLWTKVYVSFPDLMARWSKGWITLADVKAELTALGMPIERLEEFIQMKVKAAEPERVESERELTKTDIYKGIKADRLTREQGIELLMDLGFDEDEADILLDTNIPEDITDKVVAQRELSKTDIRAGLKAEELTEAQVVERLQRLRYTLADSELLLRIFKSTIKPPEEEKDRQLAKADITLGVKNGLLSPEDGYLKLQEVGFTPQDAEYLLLLKAEKSPFSPVSYSEFKERTEKLRRAAGMEEKPMSEELKSAADQVVKLTGDVEALERSIAEEKGGLVEEEVLPEAATKRLKALQVKRNRAISELTRAKSEYNRLLAEWRHGLS